MPYKKYLNYYLSCSCGIGKDSNGGASILSLDASSCMTALVIQHELFHCLGIDHEQNRPDRDNYVKIVKENLLGGII